MMTGFREQGSGIPLMLLHGISSGAASWHKQMALNGFRVLAWDMPGYGESPMLAVARANAGDYADALAAMLDRAGVWQTVLVGHSPGGAGGQRLCGKVPGSRHSSGAGRRGAGVRQCRAGAAGAGLAQPRAADGAGGRNPRPDPRPEAAAPRRARGRYRHRRGGHAGAAPGRLPCRLVDAGA
ncbi:alpha/beta fold hydrolase [Enterobacter hormaechei]